MLFRSIDLNVRPALQLTQALLPAMRAARYGRIVNVTSLVTRGLPNRTSYAEIRTRSRKLSGALSRRGFKSGDRIATLAWNTARHIEAWYGIMGIGAIYHTLNPRLFPEQIAWIMNNAEDKAIFVDLTFVPLLEKIAGAVRSLKQVIVLTDPHYVEEFFHRDWASRARHKVGVPVLKLFSHSKE